MWYFPSIYIYICIHIYIYTVCLTYDGSCLYSTWHQEPVSRCLLVRDASVILQNPQSAISSDGEEHVFMPQNAMKLRGNYPGESGNRFRRKSQPVLNGKIISGKLKNVMYKHWEFGVLRPTDWNSWLLYSQDKGITLVLHNIRLHSKCENLSFPHPIVIKPLKASNSWISSQNKSTWFRSTSGWQIHLPIEPYDCSGCPLLEHSSSLHTQVKTERPYANASGD